MRLLEEFYISIYIINVAIIIKNIFLFINNLIKQCIYAQRGFVKDNKVLNKFMNSNNWINFTSQHIYSQKVQNPPRLMLFNGVYAKFTEKKFIEGAFLLNIKLYKNPSINYIIERGLKSQDYKKLQESDKYQLTHVQYIFEELGGVNSLKSKFLCGNITSKNHDIHIEDKVIPVLPIYKDSYAPVFLIDIPYSLINDFILYKDSAEYRHNNIIKKEDIEILESKLHYMISTNNIYLLSYLRQIHKILAEVDSTIDIKTNLLLKLNEDDRTKI